MQLIKTCRRQKRSETRERETRSLCWRQWLTTLVEYAQQNSPKAITHETVTLELSSNRLKFTIDARHNGIPKHNTHICQSTACAFSKLFFYELYIAQWAQSPVVNSMTIEIDQSSIKKREKIWYRLRYCHLSQEIATQYFWSTVLVSANLIQIYIFTFRFICTICLQVANLCERKHCSFMCEIHFDFLFN